MAAIVTKQQMSGTRFLPAPGDLNRGHGRFHTFTCRTAETTMNPVSGPLGNLYSHILIYTLQQQI
jgi:hypothetical protein